ncbi:hypothetical protein [Xanthomonas phage RTH11]|nr:hypothetical protein [Xanthomonas phage RTH11]
MKHLFSLVLILTLAGCVTISMPPAQQPPSSQPTARATGDCRPYLPPQRRIVPNQPHIPEQDGDYVAFLEKLTERMVGYIGELRDYIDTEHDAEDQALRKHQLDCQ